MLRAACASAALAALVLAGCGTTPAADPSRGAGAAGLPKDAPWVAGIGGTLTLGIDQAPRTCNPNAVAGGTWAASTLLAPILPSPFIVNPDEESVYDSAVITQAEVVNTTPQTVVYSLNPSAVWSDGMPISAQDFAYAWRHQQGSSSGSSGSSGSPGAGPAAGTGTGGTSTTTLGYRDISSVTGSGRTVTVVFKDHFADWEMLFHDLLPSQVMDKVGWDPACQTVNPRIDLSAGPFEIARSTAHEVELVRNPHWWGQAPDLDRIVVRIASSSSQLAQWITKGTVQAAAPTTFDMQFLEQVAGDPAVSSTMALTTRFVQLEFSTTAPLTSNAAVRRALALEIDRQGLVDQVVGWADSDVVPAASHIYAQSQGAYPGPTPPPIQVQEAPPPKGGSPPAPAASSQASLTSPTPSRPFPPTADPTAAARLLTGAGYTQAASGAWLSPTGAPVAIDIAVDQHDQWAAQAGQVIVDQLDTAGFAATEVPEPDATSAGEALATGSVQGAVLAFSATPYPTETESWYTTLLGPPGTDGSQDWSNFDDPALDQLLERAGRQLNPVTAAPLYTQADMLLWSQMVSLPLFTEPNVLAWSSYTTGISDNPMDAGLLWYPETWALKVPPGSSDTVPG